jgi:GxxExxY protein
MMDKLVYAKESYAIMGACFNVYKAMGCGFLESVYQECLGIELEYQGIPFQAQKELTVKYRDRPLKQTFKPDFVCDDAIIVELKAVSKLTGRASGANAQLLERHRLQAGVACQLWALSKLKYERIVLTQKGPAKDADHTFSRRSRVSRAEQYEENTHH